MHASSVAAADDGSNAAIVINTVGSPSEAGQLLKSPRASTTKASLSSRIDENQLSTLACQHFLDHFCHRA